MDYKYIEQLIDRYFDCETTVAEERILKAFFSQREVPASLSQYASIFAYEDAEADAPKLGEDFDKRVMSRLEADGDAPVLHVKIQRLTFGDRIRPLWRAAAAVAIVVLVGGSVHRAYTTHPVEPISQFGEGMEEAEEFAPKTDLDYTRQPFIQEGEKVAITTDSLSATSKVD